MHRRFSFARQSISSTKNTRSFSFSLPYNVKPRWKKTHLFDLRMQHLMIYFVITQFALHERSKVWLVHWPQTIAGNVLRKSNANCLVCVASCLEYVLQGVQLDMFEASHMMFIGSEDTRISILRPFVQCSLIPSCMVPRGSHLLCYFKTVRVLFGQFWLMKTTKTFCEFLKSKEVKSKCILVAALRSSCCFYQIAVYCLSSTLRFLFRKSLSQIFLVSISQSVTTSGQFALFCVDNW